MDIIKCHLIAVYVLFAITFLAYGCKTVDIETMEMEAEDKGWKIIDAPDIPDPVIGQTCVILNNKIHILGGSFSNTHQVFDTFAKTWSLKAPIPDPNGRGWPMSTVYNGKIYLFGGGAEHWIGKKSSWVYDPDTDKWTAIADMPIARLNGGAITVGKYIYIFGGHTGENGWDKRTLDEQIVAVYRYDPSENSYTSMADCPETANFNVYAYYKGCIYVIHGCEHELYMPVGPGGNKEYVWGRGVLRYDVANNSWTKLSTKRIQQRTWWLTQLSTDATIGSKLYLVGGAPADRERVNTATYYDMENDTFHSIDPLPRPRCCGGGAAVDGKLYIIGGFYGGGKTGIDDRCKEVWVYTP